MAVEQSLHYCLSESKMTFWNIYGQPLGSMYGLFNCHPYTAIYNIIWVNFFWNACVV